LLVRELDPSRDRQALTELVITLQNHERRFDPRMPKGPVMVRRYIDVLRSRCRKWDGKMFVAEEAARVVGFVCVWARVPSEEPDDDPSDYAFVSDLVVNPRYRRRGIGRELMSAAEHYARARGARCIRLAVLARNAAGRRFYQRMKYREKELELEKILRPTPIPRGRVSNPSALSSPLRRSHNARDDLDVDECHANA
jgi:ribosomal protein S18 acetylase RimI-like enzyme